MSSLQTVERPFQTPCSDTIVVCCTFHVAFFEAFCECLLVVLIPVDRKGSLEAFLLVRNENEFLAESCRTHRHLAHLLIRSRLQREDGRSRTPSACNKSTSVQDGSRRAAHRWHTCNYAYQPAETFTSTTAYCVGNRVRWETCGSQSRRPFKEAVWNRKQPDGQGAGYNLDFLQLVQAEITALVLPTWTKTYSMIVKAIMDYHANNVFPVLRVQVDAPIEIAFATVLRPISKTFQQELDVAVVKDVGDTMR